MPCKSTKCPSLKTSVTEINLSKLFLSKVKIINNEQTSDIKSQLKKESLGLIKNLYSIIDKAVKKGVIHKNTAARKKSRFGKISANV
jgi:ribosomal protein S20